MNMTSAAVPPNVDEFPLGHLTGAKSMLVKPPRVKESPAAFECVHWQTLQLPDAQGVASNNFLIIGRIVGIYIDDRFVKDGIVDTGAMRPIARMGYMDYSVVTPESMFAMTRPSAEEAMGKMKG
jgi:flavin reductase (DIM6/NTAB) family NADH-FMN oxidoreductase RutF